MNNVINTLYKANDDGFKGRGKWKKCYSLTHSKINFY